MGSDYYKDLPENAGHSSAHGGYVSTSNLCKTCHAVHLAGSNSYRLVKSGVTDFEAGADRTQGEHSEEGAGSSRANECMYCHDATAGATLKKPYDVQQRGNIVRGEHTLGATSVPDSNINGGTPGDGKLWARNGGASGELNCYQCHSVHGANTIGYDIDFDGIPDPIALSGAAYDGDDGVENWNTKILRADPSGDGIPLGEGTAGVTAAALASDPYAVKSGFCGDCHNLNPNWVMTTADSDRPNSLSHPQGPGTDGLLEEYGVSSVSVASHLGERQGCRGCHVASDNNQIPGPSRFPHQSVGWKLLFDEYTTSGTADLAGDPNRVLPAMDQVCMKCHNPAEFGEGNYATIEQAACYRCHVPASPTGAPDIQTQFAKASVMPIGNSDLHNDGESNTDVGYNAGTPDNRHAECLDCHNPEREIQGARIPQLGADGLDVINGVAGSIPSYSPTIMNAADSNTRQYKLCFRCHSSYTSRPDSNLYVDSSGNPVVQGDRALEFNTNNSAFHPVEGEGRNQSQALKDQLYGGLDTNATLNCTDCHNADETSGTVGKARNNTFKPQGPHGSIYAPILRAFYRTDISSLPSSYDESNFQLCFRCHDPSKLLYVAGTGAGDYMKTNFSRWKIPGILKQNLHTWHLQQINPVWDVNAPGGVAVCRYCHYNIHSNQQAPNTQYEFFKNGTWTISTSPPPNFKTRLINFAPQVTQPFGSRANPAWRVWIDAQPAPVELIATKVPRDKQCFIECHGNTGAIGYMYEMTGFFNTTYRNPDIGQDNDSLEIP